MAGRPEVWASGAAYEPYATSGLPKELVVATLRSVAAEMEMPEAKLRPGDRFADELEAVRGWEFDDGIGVLSRDLARLAKKAGVSVDLGSIATLDDYIRCRVSLEAALSRRG